MTIASHEQAVGVRLHRYGSIASAPTVLYCFPHAGGAAPYFRSWPLVVPENVAVRALQLPGRQDLRTSTPFRDMTELAEAVASAVTEDADGRPFGLFGHSMGALIAFETARELRRRGLDGPRVLGASACRAPHLPPPLSTAGLSDELLFERVQQLGGMPQEVLDNRELIELSLPALRADFALLNSYRFRPEATLNVPLTVFGGKDDRSVPVDSLTAWQIHSAEPITVRKFVGDHFYLSRWSSQVAADLCAHLTD
ncbi:thioesterase II family protein [Streptomyces chartreusis]|uniref:thioesterase II family protein n=1 Tax=Streptomyces chartreusis TaxID=1969 RepID=UPI0036B8FB06